MKVVILAGGYGTRIGEESSAKPKPMIEIGDRPILTHIMSIYSRYGYHDFIICLGYKGFMIKEYFFNYCLRHSDVTLDYSNQNHLTVHQHQVEPWRVTLVDTGSDTMTGGRLKRVQPYIGDEPFMLTYGDGLADIHIGRLVESHLSHGRLATVTATLPDGRFGTLQLENQQVKGFREKPYGEGGWINAGFFVMNPGIFAYIRDDETVLEREPLEDLAKDGELMAFPFTGFWHPMDTMRDKRHLEQLWKTGNAPWSE